MANTRQFLAAILTVLLVSIPVKGFSQQDEALIKYRQNLMKGQAGHLGAMFGIVKGGTGRSTDLPVHARALYELLGMVVPAFEHRTSGGKTRAKPELWNDFTDFKQKAGDAENAADQVLKAVASGDNGSLGKALGAMGEACKACHKKYRAKKK
ncbi:MAG: c-type cytochrome [Gammaproteobacteria bacterium]